MTPNAYEGIGQIVDQFIRVCLAGARAIEDIREILDDDDLALAPFE
jgi:hypothetical protein